MFKVSRVFILSKVVWSLWVTVWIPANQTYLLVLKLSAINSVETAPICYVISAGKAAI